MKWNSLNRVLLFLTPWTTHSPWNSLGQYAGVGSLSLLLWIFPTQGSNPGLPHWRQILSLSWVYLFTQTFPKKLDKLLCVSVLSHSVVSSSLRPHGTIACQALLSIGFSRQEYWGRLPFPPPGDLPNPGIELSSLLSSVLAGRFYHYRHVGSSPPHTHTSHFRLLIVNNWLFTWNL